MNSLVTSPCRFYKCEYRLNILRFRLLARRKRDCSLKRDDLERNPSRPVLGIAI